MTSLKKQLEKDRQCLIKTLKKTGIEFDDLHEFFCGSLRTASFYLGYFLPVTRNYHFYLTNSVDENKKCFEKYFNESYDDAMAKCKQWRNK